MSIKGMIGSFIVFAFSFLIIDPSLNVMPNWITTNTELMAFTYVIWFVGCSFLFIRYGFDRR